MSLDAMVAEVDAALSRAHHLFSTATNSGGSPAADAGDTVVRAADHTRGAGGLTSGMSGRWVAGHGTFTGRGAPLLDGLGSGYQKLSGLLDAAADADRAGHTESGAVLSGERGDTTAIAPATDTPAGRKALIEALRRRVEQQRRVLQVYRARDTQLQAAIRALHTGSGGRGPGGGQGGGPGSQGGGLGGSPISGQGISPGGPSLSSAGGRPDLISYPAGRRARRVPGGPGEQAAAAALAERGTPYVWGAKGPDRFDCSGLTQYAWRQVGVQLGADTYTQMNQGVAVPAGQVRAGDLIFPAFSRDGRGFGHVMLAISPTEVVHAPQTGDVVRVAPMPDSYMARRPVPAS